MFKFLKRLRGKDVDASTPEQENQPEAVVEVLPELDLPAKDVAPVEPELETGQSILDEAPDSKDEQRPVAETRTETTALELDNSKNKKEVLEPALVSVELPKRSLGTGIRSLFSESMDIDELEEILILADFGVETAEEIAAELKREASRQGATTDPELRLLLKDLLAKRLSRTDSALNLGDGTLPYVILVVGVNGAGKTTTIGKLARWLKDGDWEVVLGAADTYRAAAVDQLETWAKRADSPIVKPVKEGADPASVAYQTVEMAIRTQADIAIIDTAGRLQNKKDLMDELGKIRRAVEKQTKISEVLLVIDATNGQNAMSQARAFTEVAEVTGIVMTKLDGTAKGGILYALQKELNLPIKLVGVGEQINDFAFFSPEEFAKGLVAKK
ncbi:cell division protein FtsY [Candidatus Aquiluna sp. IMCC13023]|uniref:signal recognition particle-docking protein FtsY n=1 Tax=Candidatus Aquiluna sp. IMCC13023 TaxID=1081644 RepID=UPI00025B2DE4|nr:signal recognition particle-docking protein FtsY [Candidatus Aquiluna sp. IMCC13023]EIC91591.1 cell division protein FtsY [Candidatus Aquiluna sp. IMCC13023]